MKAGWQTQKTVSSTPLLEKSRKKIENLVTDLEVNSFNLKHIYQSQSIGKYFEKYKS